MMKPALQRLGDWISGPGRYLATKYGLKALHQLRRNLVPRRLLSFPHLLVALWVLILLWGERWTFESKVADCAWSNWEKWVGTNTKCVGHGNTPLHETIPNPSNQRYSQKTPSRTTSSSLPTLSSPTRTRIQVARGPSVR